ncbi:hypothetical protein WCD74_24690 [Actinomycetospora sp. OC33-EN08]|uniref:Uncharacterized protein n=1 Tax=Actinomycetospora aurantiaca TaxID=3129233 RepID=A0ABU8MUI8_9PSEU
MSIDHVSVPRAAGSGPARRALADATAQAAEVLMSTHPAEVGRDRTLLLALARAKAAAESGEDGTDGRAAAAIRTASALLAAGQSEEAYLAVDAARNLFPRR